jgi:hypothetical protein
MRAEKGNANATRDGRMNSGFRVTDAVAMLDAGGSMP